jgi:hypothetical protein
MNLTKDYKYFDNTALLVFPAGLYLSICHMMNFHHDDREFGIHLLGAIKRTSKMIIMVPFVAIGVGIGRVRSCGSCNIDNSAKQDLVQSLAAMYDYSPELKWAEIGNIHRHPTGVAVPSGGDIHSSIMLLDELPDSQFFVIGIVQRTRNGTSMGVSAIDRSGKRTPFPWMVANIPSLANASIDTYGHEVSNPLIIKNLLLKLHSQKVAFEHATNENGSLDIAFDHVVHRLKGGVP